MKSDQDIKQLLDDWDNSDKRFSASAIDLSSRRDFLKQLIAGSTAVLFSQQLEANILSTKTDKLWLTIKAVQLHLFPSSPDAPDAESINAAAYLQSILEWPGVDDEDKKFITDGVGWLNGVAEKTFGKRFELLGDRDKEQVLRTIEKSQAGENWLSLIMLYLIEALLTDPVYGGNVNGQGWAWLQHQPGFPRPAKDTRYFNL